LAVLVATAKTCRPALHSSSERTQCMSWYHQLLQVKQTEHTAKENEHLYADQHNITQCSVLTCCTLLLLLMLCAIICYGVMPKHAHCSLQQHALSNALSNCCMQLLCIWLQLAVLMLELISVICSYTAGCNTYTHSMQSAL
jgi:hypothetical protein